MERNGWLQSSGMSGHFERNTQYVKKRKISGSTRSESGRKCRDTFTSLKKTCRKLGVSFWQYLEDRIENTGLIPDLSDLIRQQVLNPG